MSEMFANCSSFNQSLANWDVSSVTNMSGMFRDFKSFNQSLEQWDVGKVTNMSEMFRGCTLFNQSLETWKINPLAYSNGMRVMFFGTPAAELPFVAKWRAAGCNLDDYDEEDVYFIIE